MHILYLINKIQCFENNTMTKLNKTVNKICAKFQVNHSIHFRDYFGYCDKTYIFDQTRLTLRMPFFYTTVGTALLLATFFLKYK